MLLLQEHCIYLKKNLKQAIIKIIIQKQEMILYIKRKYIFEVMQFLKLHSLCQYKILSDIIGIDFPSRKNRFEVAYQLLSISYNQRIRIKLQTNEITPISSITAIFSGAGWFEREIWDLFGVFFFNNGDLRRILTDYGFEGFPLRKDFPLTGFIEVRYDISQKKVISEPIQLAQEFRNFDFLSPWNLNFNSNILYTT